MAGVSSQVSSVTEPDHTKSKLKLDDGDKDEAAETNYTSKSAKRGETATGFDDYSSDDDCGAPRLCPQEVEELDELCDFALSLCETQHVSSVTEPDLTKPKPKLDYGDNDEAVETKDTLKSPEQGETSNGFDDVSSDDDCSGRKLSSQEVGELVELCDFALSLYETQHPGESWKFESWHGGEQWFTLTDQYLLEFFAKKADGNSIRNFVVLAVCRSFEGREKFNVDQCVLVKDDEVEPMDENIKEKVSMESGRIFQFSPKDLHQRDYEKIVEFCKSALTYYEERHSGEAYEFVEIQTARRSIVRGIFIFHAKKKADGTLATFKAYTHLVLAMDIDVVGSFKDYHRRY